MVRCARPEPDAIDLLVGVVRKADDVAVAGETLAHVPRDRHARGARAQENFGGADGAGTEHHDVSGDEQLRRPELFATKAEWVEVYDPAALWRAFETPDRHVREDLRTVVHGVGEIIHQRGILRLVIAAAHAVAAENARLLFDADVVHAVGERDVDVELSHREPKSLTRALERPVLGEGGEVVGVGVGSEHRLRARVALLHRLRVGADRGGPDRVVEHARIGPQRDVGIDERGAAEPAAREHNHLVAHVKIEECSRLADVVFRQVRLQLTLRFERGFGKLAGLALGAAFKHADRAAGARKA